MAYKAKVTLSRQHMSGGKPSVRRSKSLTSGQPITADSKFMSGGSPSVAYNKVVTPSPGSQGLPSTVPSVAYNRKTVAPISGGKMVDAEGTDNFLVSKTTNQENSY